MSAHVLWAGSIMDEYAMHSADPKVAQILDQHFGATVSRSSLASTSPQKCDRDCMPSLQPCTYQTSNHMRAHTEKILSIDLPVYLLNISLSVLP
jgi:hypothetical protein